ncbi:UPF0149 family protein [Luteibacter aegosomatissinici]|uniref:UPF0149 family protein n=1 Tax=Luteibacter aegosomatissinici TaxID=2911539 RepID=UPI001FFA7073|nr:UPF0149 family protein [Luteibacter aegosomatissinici]UPG94027.1 UPF0149 family protein [Luteibacter aegosomatissinici]
MSANQTVDPEDIAELIGRCNLATTVSEFHGSLVGYISAGGSFPGGNVLDALKIEPDPAPNANEAAMLGRLRHQTEEWLADTDLSFMPWVPDDESPLHERVEGLADWTRGFLGGFGLGGSPEAAKALSEDAREILRDMATIASTEVTLDDDVDGDEDSLIELEEYVRVGALTLHAEMAARQEPASDTRH